MSYNDMLSLILALCCDDTKKLIPKACAHDYFQKEITERFACKGLSVLYRKKFSEYRAGSEECEICFYGSALFVKHIYFNPETDQKAPDTLPERTQSPNPNAHYRIST